jgi:hypothetical protein
VTYFAKVLKSITLAHWGFDYLTHGLQCSGIVFVIFAKESATLALKGLSVEGAQMGMAISTFHEVFDNT